MNICFVRPEPQVGVLEREPPLGILSLIAAVRRDVRGACPFLIDGVAVGQGKDVLLAEILASKPDVVCMSVYFLNSPLVLTTIRSLRITPAAKPLLIICGGPHATVRPAECLDAGADVVVLGEGEDTLVDVLRTWSMGGAFSDVPGVAVLCEAGVVCSPPRPLIDPLGKVPAPANDLVDPGRYTTTIHVDDAPAMPVMASRGCAFSCSFCSSASLWRRRIRFRPVSEVVDELTWTVDHHGITRFHFYDDNLLLNEDYIRKLARAVIQRKLAIRFVCMSTCRSFLQADAGTLELLKAAGLQMVEFGIETLIDGALIAANKQHNLNTINALVDRLEETDISAFPLLMVLLPGETIAAHQEQRDRFSHLFGRLPSVRRALKMTPDLFLREAAACTPFPGTVLWKKLEQYGIAVTTDPASFDTRRFVFLPHSLLSDVPVLLTPPVDTVLLSIAEVLPRVSPQPRNVDDVWSLVDEVKRRIDGRSTVREIGVSLGSMATALVIVLSLALHGHVGTRSSQQ